MFRHAASRTALSLSKRTRMTDGVLPVGDYTVEGDTLKISVILVKNKTPVGKEIVVTGKASEAENVIKQMVER